MAKAMAHMAITVGDMQESLRFYTEALGLQRAFEIPNPKDGSPWIVYLTVCPGQFVELFYGGTEEHAWQSRQIGFNHLCFEVEDIHAASQKVLDAGYTLDILPKQGADFNWQSWTKDPNGIRIELMQIDPKSPQAQQM